MSPLRGVRLALRFARPRGYVSWARAAAILCISGMLVFVVLGFFGARTVVAGQQRVENARNPVDVVGGSNSLAQLAVSESRWGSFDVTRVLVAAPPQSETIPPPGIPSLPLAGETYISPGYASAMQRSAVLRTALGRNTVVGIIEPEGLRFPDELRVIAGIPETNGMYAVAGFGRPTVDPLVPFDGAMAFFVPASILLCAGPLVLALVLVNRLLADRAAQRYALFHALGLRLRASRFFAGVELLPAAGIGACLGWGLFAVAARTVQHLPGTSLSFWSSDVRVPASTGALVAVAVCLATAVIGAAFTVRRPGRFTRPQPKPRRPRWWWALPLVLGALILWYTLAVIPETSSRRKVFVVWAACALLVGTLPMAHVAIDALSRYGARHARSGGVLLGARWLGNRAGAPFRLASIFCIGLVTLGLTAPFIVLLRGDVSPGADALAHARGYNVVVTNLDENVGDIAELPSVRKVLPYYSLTDGNGIPVSVVYASCEDLSDFVDDVRNCNDSEDQWINPFDGPADSYSADVVAPLRAAGMGTVPQLPRETVNASLGVQFLGAVRLSADPNSVGNVRPVGYLVNLSGSGVPLDRFESELAGRAPLALPANSYQDLIDQANSLAGYLQILLVAVAMGMVGLMVAIAVTAIRVAAERRDVSATLAKIGAGRRDRLTAHWISQTAPILVCSCVALTVTGFFWLGVGHMDPHMKVGIHGLLWGVAAVAAAALTVGLVSHFASEEREQAQ